MSTCDRYDGAQIEEIYENRLLLLFITSNEMLRTPTMERLLNALWLKVEDFFFYERKIVTIIFIVDLVPQLTL